MKITIVIIALALVGCGFTGTITFNPDGTADVDGNIPIPIEPAK